MLKKPFKVIGLPLIISAFIAGCASSPAERNYRNYDSSAYNKHNECTFNKSNCGYEGAYERGESKFAEQEARRLNLASLERLKRISLD